MYMYTYVYIIMMHAHLWGVSAFHFQVLHGPFSRFQARRRRLWHGAKLKRQEAAAQTF